MPITGSLLYALAYVLIYIKYMLSIFIFAYVHAVVQVSGKIVTIYSKGRSTLFFIESFSFYHLYFSCRDVF